MMETILCTKCGLIDDYSVRKTDLHNTAYCNGCDSYIKHLKKDNPPMLYFGKYKGREIKSLTSETEIQYLKWMLANVDLKSNTKADINEHLTKLNRN